MNISLYRTTLQNSKITKYLKEGPSWRQEKLVEIPMKNFFWITTKLKFNQQIETRLNLPFPTIREPSIKSLNFGWLSIWIMSFWPLRNCVMKMKVYMKWKWILCVQILTFPPHFHVLHQKLNHLIGNVDNRNWIVCLSSENNKLKRREFKWQLEKEEKPMNSIGLLKRQTTREGIGRLMRLVETQIFLFSFVQVNIYTKKIELIFNRSKNNPPSVMSAAVHTLVSEYWKPFWNIRLTFPILKRPKIKHFQKL